MVDWTVKPQHKQSTKQICSRRHSRYSFYFSENFFPSYFSEKMNLDISRDSSVRCQVLFTLKKKKKKIRMLSAAVVIGTFRADIRTPYFFMIYILK